MYFRSGDAMLNAALLLMFVLPMWVGAQEMHDHAAPEKLGTVSFPTSCAAGVESEFNRGVALLHSFAYKAADQAFQSIARQDPQCAIAHWGSAMTHYHQLWDLPPSAVDTAAGEKEIAKAEVCKEAGERERALIRAAGLVFGDGGTTPYGVRALKYEAAMREVAAAYPKDVEARVFYALALISNASTTDKQHTKQKEAAEILEPLFKAYPDHPGIPHYLIHAYDNQELAARGLAAARVYASVAPSAPHALHMPSHIFTRLGLWDDSIQSNLAARHAAQMDGDPGEELHAMDYLVYAFLQRGRDAEAAQVIEGIKAMPNLRMSEFKSGYAATAMPVRYVVEREKWDEAATVMNPPEAAQPQVVAIAVWARGMGLARSGRGREADKEAAVLREIEEKLRVAGNHYWSTQVEIMRREVGAWSEQAKGRLLEAVEMMRGAADEEDGIEKLPLTPGPIVPARQQLGEMVLVQGNPGGALKEFQMAEVNAPGRRGVARGEARCADAAAVGK